MTLNIIMNELLCSVLSAQWRKKSYQFVSFERRFKFAVVDAPDLDRLVCGRGCKPLAVGAAARTKKIKITKK